MLLTLANSSKITIMLIILLIILSTGYDSALLLHPYTAAVIDRVWSVGALR
jgi:hypothetical protein